MKKIVSLLVATCISCNGNALLEKELNVQGISKIKVEGIYVVAMHSDGIKRVPIAKLSDEAKKSLNIDDGQYQKNLEIAKAQNEAARIAHQKKLEQERLLASSVKMKFKITQNTPQGLFCSVITEGRGPRMTSTYHETDYDVYIPHNHLTSSMGNGEVFVARVIPAGSTRHQMEGGVSDMFTTYNFIALEDKN